MRPQKKRTALKFCALRGSTIGEFNFAKLNCSFLKTGDTVTQNKGITLKTTHQFCTVLGQARGRVSPFLTSRIIASPSAGSPAARSAIAEPLSASADLQCGDFGRMR
jgi:hypothetical protein